MKLSTSSITLCFPDTEKSCFACCPPIRPPGYEHGQHKNPTKRFLRENTENYDRTETEFRPITGFSCWAMGYLGRSWNRIGCLLHPAQNGGDDLRYRVDFGDKCSRETCLEAKTFAQLEHKEKEFWLRLAEGLDAFSYSSREKNPIFNMMNWGSELLSLVAFHEQDRTYTMQAFFEAYPFFMTSVSPRANRYLINRLIGEENIGTLKDAFFVREFEELSKNIIHEIGQQAQNIKPGMHTHLLDLDSTFLDLLRLGGDVIKITEQGANRIKEMVDENLEKFRQYST